MGKPILQLEQNRPPRSHVSLACLSVDVPLEIHAPVLGVYAGLVQPMYNHRLFMQLLLQGILSNLTRKSQHQPPILGTRDVGGLQVLNEALEL